MLARGWEARRCRRNDLPRDAGNKGKTPEGLANNARGPYLFPMHVHIVCRAKRRVAWLQIAGRGLTRIAGA